MVRVGNAIARYLREVRPQSASRTVFLRLRAPFTPLSPSGMHYAVKSHFTVEQIDATVARDFLAHLEHVRGNATSTPNLRLTALHSLFRFIARQAPELVEHAATIHAIPPRRTAVPAMAYLEKHEIDAMLCVPDRARALGWRDYALLLFLYNTGREIRISWPNTSRASMVGAGSGTA